MYSIVKDQQNEYMSVEQPDFSTLMKLTDSLHSFQEELL